MAIVYTHKRLDNNTIFYVGIGKTIKRAYSKDNRNSMWKNIINKTNYEIRIIITDLTWEDACDIERLLIKEYGRRDLGLGTLVNMTDGGDGCINNIVTKNTREKISKFKKGKKLSQEIKDKISKKHLGKKLSQEHRQKISNVQKGRKHSEESKLKKSYSVIQYDLNNNYIDEYISLRDASRKNNINCADISKVCNNKRKTAGGFIWKFKNKI